MPVLPKEQHTHLVQVIERLNQPGQAALAFILTPFVITAAFRVSDAIPTWLPFLIAVGFAVLLWTWRGALRPVAVGIASAAFAHAVLLTWLFSSMTGLDRI